MKRLLTVVLYVSLVLAVGVIGIYGGSFRLLPKQWWDAELRCDNCGYSDPRTAERLEAELKCADRFEGVKLLRVLEKTARCAECGAKLKLRFELDPIFMLRFMRQLAAFTIGASLALAGAVFQSVLRNPLAEPFTLGISGGSGVGAALAIVLHLNAYSFMAVPLCALTGALVALGVVLWGVGGRRDGGETILLGGVIVGTIFGSVLMYILSIADNDQLAGVTWWMLGDLQTVDPRLLSVAVISLILATVLLRGLAGGLNALAFGDTAAWNFGGDPVRLRKVLILIASLLAAETVALAGMIGFVGLMIPHALRRFCGCDHRRLLWKLVVFGGVFLMLCDLISRVIDPIRELPIGVITSALGGSLFLYFLKARWKR